MHFTTVGSSYHTTVATRARFASGSKAKQLGDALAAIRKAIAEEPNSEQLLTDFKNLTGNHEEPTPPIPKPPKEAKA